MRPTPRVAAQRPRQKALGGKKQPAVDRADHSKLPEYLKKLVEAYGFPRAEK